MRGVSVIILLLWGNSCFSFTQVLANNEAPEISLREPRQGIIGSPYILSPGSDQRGLFLPSLALSGQNIPLLQQELQQQQLQQQLLLQQLPYATAGGLQDFSGLQDINSQSLQDQQTFMRRLGPLGLGNGLGNGLVGLGPAIALRRSPFIGGLRGFNPILGRGGGGQESLQDLLGLAKLLGIDGSDESKSFGHHSTLRQQTPSSFTTQFSPQSQAHHHNDNNEDKELIALLQTLNSLQPFSPNNRNLALTTAASLPPGLGASRLSPQLAARPFLGRGGPLIPGVFNLGLNRRTGLESDDAVDTSNRVGIPVPYHNDAFQHFQHYQQTPTIARHKLQEIETDTDNFRFPFSG